MQTVYIVVIINAVIVVGRASSAAGVRFVAIQKGVVGIEVRDVIRTGLNGSGRVGDEMIAYMIKGTLHGEGFENNELARHCRGGVSSDHSRIVVVS